MVALGTTLITPFLSRCLEDSLEVFLTGSSPVTCGDFIQVLIQGTIHGLLISGGTVEQVTGVALLSAVQHGCVVTGLVEENTAILFTVLSLSL